MTSTGTEPSTLAPAQPVTAAALEVSGIEAGYGRTTVLRDVSISVPHGSIVALLGPNGAGKTTLLRAAAGLVRPSRGTVSVDGADVTTKPPNRRARSGLCLIPEGRGIFRSLTVQENLRLQVPRWIKDASLEQVVDMFPALRTRLRQTAGTLSGGEQQMLAIARSCLAGPSVVLLDEVSMGLAPKVVDAIFDALTRLAATGVSLLLVEQYVTRALSMADQVVLLERGTVAFAGAPGGLQEDAILRGYLGLDVPREGGEAVPSD
jgi:branched-chain amino acid transport system ATP-binding protein